MPDAATANVSFAEADANLVEMLDSLGGADNYLDFLVELFEPHLLYPVLEVGAGHGDLTARLASAGPVQATDLSERCLTELRTTFADDRAVTVDRLDIGAELPADGRYSPDGFGSVVMANVLEHIGDDAGALRRLARVIRPGGTVVVFVPAFQALYGRFDRLIGHERRYRTASLRSVFERAGLEPVELRYVNLPGYFAWLITVRLLGVIPTDGRLVRLYDRAVIPAVRAVERHIRPPFGQSVLGVARRSRIDLVDSLDQ